MKRETKRKIRPPGRAAGRAGPSGGKKSGSKGGRGKTNSALSGSLKKAGCAVKEKLQTVNVRKVLITNIPYFIVFYLVEK